MFLDKYGTEGLNWSPETIIFNLEEETYGKFPSTNTQKILGAIQVLTSNEHYYILSSFLDICKALNGGTLPYDWFVVPSMETLAWAVFEIYLIDTPDQKPAYSEDISAYMHKHAEFYGYAGLPTLIKPLFITTDEIQYKGHPSNLMVEENVSDVTNNDALYETITFKKKMENQKELDEILKNRLVTLTEQLESLPLIDYDKEGRKKAIDVLKKVIESYKTDGIPELPELLYEEV